MVVGGRKIQPKKKRGGRSDERKAGHRKKEVLLPGHAPSGTEVVATPYSVDDYMIKAIIGQCILWLCTGVC